MRWNLKNGVILMAHRPVERIVLLPVCEATGEVDYMYLEYDLQTIEDTQQEHLAVIDGWEFRPFKIVPAT